MLEEILILNGSLESMQVLTYGRGTEDLYHCGNRQVPQSSSPCSATRDIRPLPLEKQGNISASWWVKQHLYRRTNFAALVTASWSLITCLFTREPGP